LPIPSILVAIPVFNEIKYVRQVLDKVRQFHKDILVIDDGSTDGTRKLLRELAAQKQIQLLLHDRNLGYGQSIIDAFNFAHRHGYDWVITMDCDEQHEPEMIPKFVSEIQTDQWDIISGSRYLEARTDNDLPPGDRRSINAAITSALNGLFEFGITDAFCGFKAHRVCSMIALALDESGYAFPLQFWPRAARAGLRIKEIPVREKMEAMMGGAAGSVTVTKGGAREVAGYSCQDYTIAMGQTMTTKLCATTALAFPIPKGDAEKFKSFATSAGMMAQNPMFKGLSKVADEMKKVEGVTIAESTSIKMMGRNMDSSKEATEIKKGPIPASAFDLATIAKGYKKVPNPITQMK
jgi:dolichol-phosphate mannosyltransferase